MWSQHWYSNKLGYYWQQRELTKPEQKRLHMKMVFNYYGFWANKICHLSMYYVLYKRGFFGIPNEFAFYTKLGILTLVLYISNSYIDTILNLTLAFELEELQAKYSSQIDSYRKEYLQDKSTKDMDRRIKLQELQDSGVNVRQLINPS